MMKFRRYSKSTARIPLLICLLFSVSLFCACQKEKPPLKPTPEESINEAITKIARQEYEMKLKSWLVGRSLWVYLPLEDILDEKLQLTPEAIKKIDGARLGIFRVFLNAKEPVDFCVFYICDTKKGFGYYQIMNKLDIKKLWFGFISRGDFTKRAITEVVKIPASLNDKEGGHFKPYDISWSNFILMQIKKDVKLYFEQEENKDDFNLNKFNAQYKNESFLINLEISPLDSKHLTGPASIKPYKEIIRIIARIVHNYNFEDFLFLNIEDEKAGFKRSISALRLLDFVS